MRRRSRAPRAVTRGVARACGFLATPAAASPGSTQEEKAARRARKAWQKAARALTRAQRGPEADCRKALVNALETRAATR